MPATVPTRGVLKISQNRVRTSVSLQGSNMWENVIGIVNEDRGTNTGVEALINAPQHGGAHRQAKEARRAAAVEAVKATGGFDTAVTDYDTLLTLAKSQGAVGSTNRGACKICGQLGHLTKQCRNQFSKFYVGEDGAGKKDGEAGGQPLPAAGADPVDSSDYSGLSSDSDSSSSEDRRKSSKSRDKKRKRSSKSGKDKKHKKSKSRSRKEKKSKKSKKRRRDSSSSSASD